MNETSPSLALLRRALEHLIGEECWSVTTADGGLLALGLGQKRPRSKPLKNVFLSELERTHEAELWVHVWSSWRLDGESDVLSVWTDPTPAQCPTPPDLACLCGARVTGFELTGPARDLTLHFGEVGSLRVFCDQSVLEPEGDNYAVSTPLGTLTVEAGGQLSLEARRAE